MEKVFIDHNLQKNSTVVCFCPSRGPACQPPAFQEMPLRVIMVGAMLTLTKNPGFATGTGRLLERNKMLKKGPEEFLPGP